MENGPLIDDKDDDLPMNKRSPRYERSPQGPQQVPLSESTGRPICLSQPTPQIEDSCHKGPFDHRTGGGYTKNNKKQHLRMWDFLDQLHIRYISIWYLWVHPDIASWRYPQSHDSCPMGNLWWTMGSKGRVDHVAARCTVFFCWVSEVKKHTLMCIYNCIHNYTHTVYNICIMYIYIYIRNIYIYTYIYIYIEIYT